MKRQLPLGLFLAFCLLFPGMLFAQSATLGGGTKGSGPVGYWNFDEAGGPATYDQSGNANNGTLSAGGTGSNTTASQMWYPQGKFGGAMQFDGDDYVNLGDPANGSLDFGVGDFSLEAWFKLDSLPGAWTGIINKGTSGAVGYAMHINTGNALTASIQGTGGTNQHSPTVSGLSAGQWYHAVIVFDRDVDIKIYLDGYLRGSGGYDAGNTNSIDNGSALTIGSYGSSAWFFPGLIDEVKIYNRALSADEIKMAYNAGAAAHFGGGPAFDDPWGGNPPVAWWSFDENSGTNAYDRSGSGNDGTITNATWAHGKHGNALSFDGDGDYVSIPTISTAKTQEAWIYITQLASVKGNMNYLFSNFYQHSANNYFYFTGTNDYVGWVPSINTWYHISLTYTDPANTNTAKLYVNGISYNASQQTGPHDIDPITSISTSGAGAFKGLIDDVKIYNYARTQAQIAWDYNKGKPVGWWKFDENTGTTAYDSSGNGRDGVIHGSTWVDGKFGKAIDFADTQTTDYIDIPYTAINGLSDFTITFWAYGGGGGEYIISGSNGTDHNYMLMNAPTTSGWHFYVWRRGGGYGTHIYQDFVETDSLIYTNPGDPINIASGGFIIAQEQDALGGGFDPNQAFSGMIDDMRIYNYARTAGQVRQDYNEGSAVHLGD